MPSFHRKNLNTIHSKIYDLPDVDDYRGEGGKAAFVKSDESGIEFDNLKSSDGTAGVTANVAVAKVGGGTRTLHFKNGLYTGYTDS